MSKSVYLFYGLVLTSFYLIANEVDFGENFPLYIAHILIGLIAVKIITRKDCGMMTQAAGIFFFIFFQFFRLMN